MHRFSVSVRARIAPVVLLLVILGTWIGPAAAREPEQTGGSQQAVHQVFVPTAYADFIPFRSIERIQAALENGEIDRFTSLLYRFYARFHDERLPGRFQGAAVEDPSLFLEAAALLPSLPPARQAQLQAFLVYPDDPRSAWSQAQGVRSEAGAQVSPCWVGRESPIPGINVKVWAACDELAEVEIAITLGLISDLWGPMTAHMGQPLPDGGGAGSGGSPDIDIYLLTSLDEIDRSDYYKKLQSGGGEAPPTHIQGSRSSGYIMLDRWMLDEALENFKSTLAHEFFHVLQHAHNYQVYSDPVTHEEWWFTEASAAWAEQYFVPEAAAGIHSKFREFQNSPLSLNLRLPVGHEQHNLLYAAYIWPFFMELELGPDSIARAWDEIAKIPNGDMDAADQAVDGVLSFDLHFHRFAVRNLNLDLQPGNPVAPRYVTKSAVFPDGEAPSPLPFEGLLPGQTFSRSENIPNLKAHYYRLVLDEAVQTTVIRLTPGPELDLDILMRKKNEPWTLQNFPAGTEIRLCDLEALYLVVSNPDLTTDSQVSYTLEVEAQDTPCSCDLSTVQAFEGSFSFDYSHQAQNGDWTYTLNQSASGSAVLPVWDESGNGKTYLGIPTGSGSIDDTEIDTSDSPPDVDVIQGSGPLMPDYNGEEVSKFILNIDKQACTYNLVVQLALVGEGGLPNLLGTAYTERLPLTANLSLSGSHALPAHSTLWIVQQPEPSFSYWPGGFGTVMFFNVVGIMNQAGNAQFSWQLQPDQ